MHQLAERFDATEAPLHRPVERVSLRGGVRQSERFCWDTATLCVMTDRHRYSSGARWEPVVGYSRAIRVGERILVAGTTAAADGGPVGGQDAGEQTREALRRIAAALEALDGTLADLVLTRIYVTRMSDWEAVGRAHGEVFGEILPVTTLVEVSALVDPALLVEIEAEAVVG